MIIERARELGRLLGQSEEYRALLRADERLKEDSEAGALLEELKQLDQQLHRSVSQGEQPPKEKREAYEALVRRIEALPRYQGFIAAQTNFDKLMHKVNQEIYGGMKTGASSRIITLG